MKHRREDPAEIEKGLRSSRALDRAKALTEIRTAGTIASLFDAIVERFGDPEPMVAKQAVWVFNRAGRGEARRAFPRLIEALRSMRPEVRQAAAACFMHCTFREAVPPLLHATEDPDPHVRSAAAGAIANLGPRAAEALPRMKALLEDPEVGVRRVVAGYFENMGRQGRPALAALRAAANKRPEDRRMLRPAFLSIQWPIVYGLLMPIYFVVLILREQALNMLSSLNRGLRNAYHGIHRRYISRGGASN